MKGAISIIGQIVATTEITVEGIGWITSDATSTAGTLHIRGTLTHISGAGGITIDDLTLQTRIDAIFAEFALRTEVHIPPASAPIQQILITTVAADKNLGSIAVGAIPTGTVVSSVRGWLNIGAIENTNVAANKLSGAQDIQIKKAGGAWHTVLSLPADFLSLAGSKRESGRVLQFNIDASTPVDSNDTYTLQLTNGLSAANNLVLNDLQWGLEIEYK